MGKVLAYVIGILVLVVILLALLTNWQLGEPGAKQNDNPVVENPAETGNGLGEGDGGGGNSNVREVFLSKDGISFDRKTWHQAEEFPGLAEQLKNDGILHVINRREPTSIERYEIPWNEAIDATGIKRTEE